MVCARAYSGGGRASLAGGCHYRDRSAVSPGAEFLDVFPTPVIVRIDIKQYRDRLLCIDASDHFQEVLKDRNAESVSRQLLLQPLLHPRIFLEKENDRFTVG